MHGDFGSLDARRGGAELYSMERAGFVLESASIVLLAIATHRKERNRGNHAEWICGNAVEAEFGGGMSSNSPKTERSKRTRSASQGGKCEHSAFDVGAGRFQLQFVFDELSVHDSIHSLRFEGRGAAFDRVDMFEHQQHAAQLRGFLDDDPAEQSARVPVGDRGNRNRISRSNSAILRTRQS